MSYYISDAMSIISLAPPVRALALFLAPDHAAMFGEESGRG